MTAPTAQPRPAGARTNTLLEFAGFACLAACAFFVWPPAALGVAGVVLVVVANLRAAKARPRPARPPLLERLARAAAAYRGGGSP